MYHEIDFESYAISTQAEIIVLTSIVHTPKQTRSARYNAVH